jgi:hypothetical protein
MMINPNSGTYNAFYSPRLPQVSSPTSPQQALPPSFYQKAQEKFDSGPALIRDRNGYNSYRIKDGLSSLTQALQQDMSQIKNQLAQIQAQLNARP